MAEPTPTAAPVHVFVVTDERYSSCDADTCTCTGILGEVFASEQTARQYAERQGGRVSRREVHTRLPSWVRA